MGLLGHASIPAHDFAMPAIFRVLTSSYGHSWRQPCSIWGRESLAPAVILGQDHPSLDALKKLCVQFVLLLVSLRSSGLQKSGICCASVLNRETCVNKDASAIPLRYQKRYYSREIQLLQMQAVASHLSFSRCLPASSEPGLV